jgi:voltage-dependent potassium channel beta subunit
MEYRRLGASGIKVSELSFGSWVTFGKQIDLSIVIECLKTAYDAGVNFFDNAEAYALGESETLMGQALKKLGFRRGSYLVSSKFFWGLHQGPNEKNTLNRKYLLEAVDGSLKRLQLDHLDLIFCHRPDPHTPIEETVWAMHDIITRGKALYWGTSEWSAEEIRQAYSIADRHHLRRPVMEQPEYNLLHRRRLEVEYAPLFKEFGMGTTTWSPLASGVLTGKYLKGMPPGSRLSLKGMEWLKDKFASPQIETATKSLQQIADSLDCSLAQLALAWCLKNPNVSTVITGATSAQQLKENLGATQVLGKLEPEVLTQIEGILAHSKIEA